MPGPACSLPAFPHGRWSAVIGLLLLIGCGSPDRPAGEPFTAEDLRKANRKLLEVVMVDGFNPPVASRVYAYPHIAHHLTLHAFYPDSLEDLATALNDLDKRPEMDLEGAHPQLTALLAFCRTARIVVFTEHAMDELAEGFVTRAKAAGMRADVIDASEKAATAMATALKTWMDRDGYVHTRTMDRHTSPAGPGTWSETPPDYTAALEPNWHHMRPLLLPRANAFTVPPMHPYSPEPGSAFREMVMEMYQATKELNDSTSHIALYWDDNPNISSHRGHLTTQEHRIAPPGHWLNIAGQVTRRDDADLFTTTRAFTLASIAMYDGLISCWHEKFRTDVVRPITFIQEQVEPEWSSLIQTPPFPEYPSGHSVVSAAAATVLDHVLGADRPFLDSTEVMFGMGTRQFTSYQDAAWEVSMSRFYGGIHYMPSIAEGYTLGRAIGDHTMASLQQQHAEHTSEP